MRVGSLFTGIGGIELGFERAGFETVWVIERDPYAQAILRRHFPNATLHEDVTTVDFARLPRVDVITAGFPCQDISNAGRRAGITGDRSGLWRYCLDALRHCRPRIALFENVAALTYRGLDTVLCDLAAIGHAAEWHCVPAASVGAPHRRDRIFILAYPDGSQRAHQEPQEHPAQAGQQAQRQPPDGRPTIAEPGDRALVANADSRDVEARREGRTIPEVSGQHRTGRRRSRPGGVGAGWWAVEPGLGRVAPRVPHWMDRIKCLGNSVVPAVAQAIAESIKETINEERAVTDRRKDHHD